jgi:hypothetical protein
VTEHVGVTPRELLHHVPELRAGQTVTVGDNYELGADDDVDLLIGETRAMIAARSLVADCPDVAPFAGYVYVHPPKGCMLLRDDVRDIRLATHHHVDWDLVKVFAGALLVTAAIGSIADLVCRSSASGC